MSWAAPGYAWLILLLIPAGILLAWTRYRRIADVSRFLGPQDASTHARQTPHRRLGAALSAFAIVLLIVSLCRPQWGSIPVPQQSRGADVIIALDVSRSMLADDMLPNRLVAAKRSIASLLKTLHGERVGLIAFAGSAFLVCPLTNDYETFTNVLEQTDPSTIPLGGTSLASALNEARRAFGERPEQDAMLIVITDGEDHTGGATEAADKLTGAGVILHAATVGTAMGGLIPLGNGQFLKRGDGTIVMSRLQTETLRTLAGHSSGRLVDLAAQPEALSALLVASNVEQKQWRSSSTRTQFEDRYQIPLALVLLLLVAEPLFGARVRR